jgi:hypothetical protein
LEVSRSSQNGACIKKGSEKVENKGQENLIPFNERTEEEQRKIARQGGIASGEARREKATFKKTLEMLLDEKNSKGKTYRELITLGQIKSAVDGKADNFKTILALLGEINSEEAKETPSVTINVVDNSNLEKVMYESEEK